MFKTLAASSTLSALVLAAGLSVAPMAAAPAQAGDACKDDVWSEACKQQMIKAICLAGGGTQETCKPAETRRPTLHIQPTVMPQRPR